jgi:hypothetical protein
MASVLSVTLGDDAVAAASAVHGEVRVGVLVSEFAGAPALSSACGAWLVAPSERASWSTRLQDSSPRERTHSVWLEPGSARRQAPRRGYRCNSAASAPISARPHRGAVTPSQCGDTALDSTSHTP